MIALPKYHFLKGPILPDGTEIIDFEYYSDLVHITLNCNSPLDYLQFFCGAKLNGEKITEERANEVLRILSAR